MIQLKRQHHTIDILFPLILLGIFCGASLLLVFYGAKEYKANAAAMDQNFNTRTCASYIREKIHQNDMDNAISVLRKDGLSLLKLKQEIDGKTYATYIYAYENKIHEILVAGDTPFSLSDGQQILDITDISFAMISNHLLKIAITDADGYPDTVYINITSMKQVNYYE